MEEAVPREAVVVARHRAAGVWRSPPQSRRRRRTEAGDEHGGRDLGRHSGGGGRTAGEHGRDGEAREGTRLPGSLRVRELARGDAQARGRRAARARG